MKQIIPILSIILLAGCNVAAATQERLVCQHFKSPWVETISNRGSFRTWAWTQDGKLYFITPSYDELCYIEKR